MNPSGPILYVDDEEHNLTVFEAAFEDDYEVLTASSAREAIGILREREIRLIISDQRMPEMTGVQLFEAILRDYPDVVRMILTGYTDIDAIIRAVNAGRIYRYITKPWDEKELKVIMDRALESYDLEMRNRRLMGELERRAADEEKIRKKFQRYVPAAVIDELLDSSQQDHFLGESRIVAVVFFGIHDSHRLTSRLPPMNVLVFLNHYYSTLNRIVSRHDGTIKDGKLAVFGAPVSSLDNAGNAVKAALEMVDAMAEFNRGAAVAMVGEEVSFGIGINLGEVVAGNIGSDERMEYTVIGDTVNVAARIHELTRADPSQILLSQSVLDWTDDQIGVEALDPVELRGRTTMTQLYRILAKQT